MEQYLPIFGVNSIDVAARLALNPLEGAELISFFFFSGAANVLTELLFFMCLSLSLFLVFLFRLCPALSFNQPDDGLVVVSFDWPMPNC